MMECNKEEAIRAKEIAEKKMQNRDFMGAKKLVLKAQQLFPELENISHMLTVCEVHCSAGVKVNGEMDWYGILQLEPTADDLSIKKQYRKLALLLHPDKNQFTGAEAAFKLIGEAQMTLSDRIRRYAYDSRRNATAKSAQARQRSQQPSKTSHARNSNTTVNFNGLNQQQPSAFTPQTFWTMCANCGMRYQYWRALLKKALRCQNCQTAFIAEELTQKAMPAATNSGQSWHAFRVPQAQIPVQQAKYMNQQSQFGNAPPNMAFQERAGGKQGLNMEHEGRPTNVGSDGKADTKSRAVNEARHGSSEHTDDDQRQKAAKSSTANAGQKRRRNMVVESSDSDSSNSEEITLDECGNPTNICASAAAPRRSARLKQKVACSEDGSGDENGFEDALSHKKLRPESAADGHEDTLPHGDANGVGVGVNGANLGNDNLENRQKEDVSSAGLPNGSESKDGVQESKKVAGRKEEKLGLQTDSSPDSSSKKSPETRTYTYPDPEFCDFDKSRSISQFAVDQIWAVYDNLDGMPRFYARIRRICAPEFEVRYTWLEHNPRNEAETAWTDEELPVACGIYKLGQSERATDRLMFSHIVCWEKGKKKNSYNIYPRKGEVWALFKGWNMGWISDGEKNRSYEYEVVEVLSDFSTETGISVIPLVKIKGFVSLFMRAKETEDPVVVPASEILRFSHNVPAYRLTGNEREGLPEGSLELDSASLPSDFGETFRSVSLGSTTSRDENLVGCRKSFWTDDDKEQAGTSRVHEGVKRGGDLLHSGVTDADPVKEDRASQSQGSDACKHVCSEAKQSEIKIDEKDGLDVEDINDEKANENGISSPTSALNDYTFDYPDPEFYNFDEGRRIENFRRGQIWALYSDIDKYPKYYGYLKKVEVDELRIHVAWLEACPNIEEEIRWLNEEMPVSYGTFKASQDTMTFETTDAFSHLVHAKSTSRPNRFVILPSCGEIWAMYKNWKPGWRRTDLEECEYDVVEICEITVSSIKVRLLKKVHGYRAVFKPEGNGRAVTTIDIPLDGYIRFSHQIPAFSLTNEKGGKLRGFWELDPASVPEVLLISDI